MGPEEATPQTILSPLMFGQREAERRSGDAADRRDLKLYLFGLEMNDEIFYSKVDLIMFELDLQ